MKLTLKKEQHNESTFITTEILGAKVTLSKALTQKLKDTGRLKKEIETDDSMILVTTTKDGKNGKVWANLYLTVKKDKDATIGDAESDLLF